MGPLLNAVTDLVALLSPPKIDAIASRLRAGAPNDGGRSLHQIVGTSVARAALDSLIAAWEHSELPGDVVAGILIGAAHARSQSRRDGSVELVWTGPTTPYVPTRRTEQVLLDLIQRAKSELFIVSFVAYDVPTVITAINSAIDRGVETRILVEASMAHGGSLLMDPVATMRSRVPSALLYSWTDRPPPFTNGRPAQSVAVLACPLSPWPASCANRTRCRCNPFASGIVAQRRRPPFRFAISDWGAVLSRNRESPLTLRWGLNV